MACEFVKTFLLNFLLFLNRVKARLLSKMLDWECITKPLREATGPLTLNMHKPTLEEYRRTYVLGKKVKTAYDWWYSTLLEDIEGNLYFFVLVFHPKWSFFRFVRVNQSEIKETSALPTPIVIGSGFYGKMGYLEHENEIEIWVRKTQTSRSSETDFARSIIRVRENYITVKKDEITVYLTFTSLGLPFWINKGREATSTPKGDKMSGFYDICQTKGLIIEGSLHTEIHGVGINEHLMSFTPPNRYWQRVDGIFICFDQLYCAFIYLENRVGSRKYEYKDGAVFLRTTGEYLMPIDFKIEYLKYDEVKKVPTKIRILAKTTKGELDVVSQAIVEIEGQLAVKTAEGYFVFGDGSKLRLTNGYGQHALR
jgi:hypothetical protein